ncbi:MAG: hypothetical protein C0631_02830 [Sedimenticola sp.]|nr:MAG: hypothetical protein C0631_02830 [Sedimenticola sp.]
MVYRDSRRSAFWIPTRLGKILAKTPEWKATLNDYHLTITVGNRVTCCHVSEVIDINVRCGFFWAVVVFTFGTNQQISIDWIRNAVARDLRNCILYNKVFFKRSEELQKQKELDERKRREDATRKKKKEQRDLAKFKSALTSILEWVSAVKAKLKACREKPRWFTSEEEEYLLKTKPNSTYISLLKKPVVKYFLEAAEPDVIDAIDFWQGDLRAIVSKHNADFSESEPSDCKGYLDQVEKSPLTDEQSRAVICFDNRVLLVASAGSGKTSTMVARAGYALHRKLVKPDRILLLAFNKDAAIELQTRITQQLEPLGFPVSKFVARTFHAFGLQIIGKATGKKPHLAPWLDQGKDLEKLAEIVDHLKDNDPSYRAKWDIFRLVFSRDLSKFGSQDEPEDWDGRTSASGFRTLGGEIVKSREERLIADWLFYNGIEYLYEHPYEYQTADVDHGQYHPDFYYPGANAYHEHFALDANGIPPSNFDGYMEGVQWKRELHATRETTLWETTSATIRDGTAFDILSQHLTAAGVTLDPNPDRPVQGRWVVENSELFKLFRTFLTHVKSNEFTNETLLSQIDSQNTDAFRYRHQIFLQLFTPIREEWDRRLRSEGAVDFEDMLNRAAHLLEKEKWKSPFELVMVDEFQDA